MTRPLSLFIVLLCLPVLAAKSPAPQKTALQYAAEVETDILGDNASMSRFKKRMDQAINTALHIAYGELRKKGEGGMATGIQWEWQANYGSSLFWKGRGIGDHRPVNEWLKDTYNKIENVLGRDLCIRTHIAAIKSLNFGVPVVVDPCNFPMDAVPGERVDEYRKHFCGGEKVGEPYHGVAMEVTFFAIYAGCAGATAGSGFSFICGAVASVGEKIIENYVAPGLSDKIYVKACGA